jgi:hypothetical protein
MATSRPRVSATAVALSMSASLSCGKAENKFWSFWTLSLLPYIKETEYAPDLNRLIAEEAELTFSKKGPEAAMLCGAVGILTGALLLNGEPVDVDLALYDTEKNVSCWAIAFMRTDTRGLARR